MDIHNGKALCYNALCKREYGISHIRSSITKEEYIHIKRGNGLSTSSWDKVTAFYDAYGKKLFRFGLAYNNVEQLKKDVENTQKSIRKNQKQK